MSVDHLIQAGISQGLLPPDAAASTQQQRPWPVIVLTALGGWLAALPLLAAVIFLFDDYLRRGSGPYIVGLAAMALAVFVLRRKDMPLFLEQLAIPVLLAGGGALAFGLDNDVSNGVLFSIMALLAIAVAAMVPQRWLRTLLGATACGMLLAAMTTGHGRNETFSFILALHVALLLWICSQLITPRLATDENSLDIAYALDAAATGWVTAILAGLAIFSGSTFLASSILPGDDGGFGFGTRAGRDVLWNGISALAAAAAALHLARTWPTLKQPWAAAGVLAAVGLSFFMPSLGATVLILAICVTGGRWAVAGAAGLAAAWIIGAFYYQLSMPLASKAMIMLGTGIMLGGSAWFALRGKLKTDTMKAGARDRLRASAGIALTAVAVLVVVNASIWQKEDLIAKGKPVFIELAPVDPRSLMQGDYMTLNFLVPDNVSAPPGAGRMRDTLVVGKVDARGVLTITRRDDGTPLASDEMRILIKTDGPRTRIATDAWYFREGDGGRYEKAKYGEFRVLGDGRALLVGLRGPALEKL
ncbi:GDYXXLXY domain-containing protein [Massilia sp. PAMC28688]|uniref:GDYXXLXY domain-containing protein n=1 Tax=Massilia sp. PAMC28688 TaxID=2861283 RepID=UPI001C638F3D|nr:GDYXXLXY domain-containing protein [Massilia sp. PAMC28688]QYF94606.1 GDYXXLXY domain-containing protein [Massilia sp. PAMC28688]